MDLDDETTAAMAAAMGFSSFGAQNPSKRRKYNPRTDAVGTGSNTTPLGARAPNADEIDLDDDDDDDDAAAAAADGAPAAAAGGEPTLVNPAPPPIAPSSSLPSQPLPRVGNLVGSSTLPPRPRDPPAPAASARGGRGGRAQPGPRDRGGRPWWEDYYDPACNVNPWEHVERLNGLEPRGAWLSYQESKSRWEALKKPRWDERQPLPAGRGPEGEEMAAQPAGPVAGTQGESRDAGPAAL